MFSKMLVLFGVFVSLGLSGCTQHRVEVAPVEVKPIHITIDVNVKVDRALDSFFNDIDSAEKKLESNPSGEQ